MSHTFTQLTYHAVFGTKGRLPEISDDLQARLYPYLGAFINNNQGFARQIGGMREHLHILFDLHQGIHRQRLADPSGEGVRPQPGETP